MFAYQNQTNGQFNEIYYGHALVYEEHGDCTEIIAISIKACLHTHKRIRDRERVGHTVLFHNF